MLDGTAEQIPLPDGAAHAVFVAQAFHWFRVPEAAAEIARVLDADGALAIVRNQEVESATAPAVTAALALVRERVHHSSPRHRVWRDDLEQTRVFEPFQEWTVDNAVTQDIDTFRHRIASRSYIGAMDDDRRARLLDEVQAVLEANGVRPGEPFAVPTVTRVIWARAATIAMIAHGADRRTSRGHQLGQKVQSLPISWDIGRLPGVRARRTMPDPRDTGERRQPRRVSPKVNDFEGSAVTTETESLTGSKGSPTGPPQMKKNAISYVSNIVIGVASTAPAYSLAATVGFFVLIIGVGVHSPAIIVVSFIPLFFIATAYKAMNEVDPDCGTTFSWVTRAISPSLGLLIGWTVIFSDIVVNANQAQIAGSYGFQLFGLNAAASNTLDVVILGVVFIVAADLDLLAGDRTVGADPADPARLRDDAARSSSRWSR